MQDAQLLLRDGSADMTATLSGSYVALPPAANGLILRIVVPTFSETGDKLVVVFTYSDEDGTAAFDLEGRVPAKIKKARQSELMRIQKRISLRRNKARVGSRVEVLVEGSHQDTDLLLVGRLASQAPEIDGSVLISDPGETPPGRGEFVRCEITRAHAYDVEARVV